MRGIIIVLMAILGVIFPKFLVKAIKSTDKNDAGGGLLGSQITFGMLMLIIGRSEEHTSELQSPQ